MSKATVERMNRLLFEDLYPENQLARHGWDTPWRKKADTSKLYGNANFALLVSAVIALLLYVQQRKPSRREFGLAVENALMSGGLIILITSAGGAFGAMLQAAQIGPAIQDMFTGDGGRSLSGIMLLVLGFFMASLLKVAQGSSTVAMITASAIVAGMFTPDALSFHPVYIATAIGAGSLVGSWMNDSGFWIFAKMGGVTEVEALKSWLPMLAVMGVVALLVTIVMALVLPMGG
jgi:H+/gluconate symporter-like permease